MRTLLLTVISLCSLAVLWTGCEKEETKDCTNRFTDERDGQEYCMVTIGTQTWMAENLRYLSDSSYENANNPSTVNAEYGRLYPFQEALKVCPNGWHLPTDAEWKILEDQVGLFSNLVDQVNERGVDQGNNLKSIEGWDETTNTVVANNNSFGFNALPAGEHNPSFGPFFNLGKAAKFWTATVYDSTGGAWNRELNYDEGGIRRSYFSQKNAYSCRCVRD